MPKFRYLLILAILAGCVEPIVWNGVGVDRATFDKDNYECERDARQSGYFGGGIAGAMAMRDFYARCMEARGYKRQK